MRNEILIIDNYDSFTYNLFHYVYSITGIKPVVARNDSISAADAMKHQKIILSPGPGLPHESGRLMELIAALWENAAILGVCLGHQALALHSGANLTCFDEPFHGISRQGFVRVAEPLYTGLADQFLAGSYHSWTVDASTLPDCWHIAAEDQTGEILALQHKVLPIFGVQYHPESILSTQGRELMQNWITHEV
ncbi:MAG: anthranilate synthase component II [Bacteroidia bacterium]